MYVPCLYVLNKIDAITIEELDLLDQIPHYVPISAHLEWNLDELLERIWQYLALIRMYVPPIHFSLIAKVAPSRRFFFSLLVSFANSYLQLH